MNTCKNCANFLGGGDWNLCCKNPPEDQLTWIGFICYEDTEACKNFKPKELAENQEFYRELIQEQHSCG
jgi:hypothetical protein